MLQRNLRSFLGLPKSSYLPLREENISGLPTWSRTLAIMAPSKVSQGSKPRVIYWFRTDLRLHDSPALNAALELDPEVFYPIWTWDPHYVYRARVGPNRWQFL
jgi:DNA photolyase